jgi:hypothetical protein
VRSKLMSVLSITAFAGAIARLKGCVGWLS